MAESTARATPRSHGYRYGQQGQRTEACKTLVIGMRYGYPSFGRPIAISALSAPEGADETNKVRTTRIRCDYGCQRLLLLLLKDGLCRTEELVRLQQEW
jgi:hypothetical protein